MGIRGLGVGHEVGGGGENFDQKSLVFAPIGKIFSNLRRPGKILVNKKILGGLESTFLDAQGAFGALLLIN